jgi:hypothetical protein
MLSFALDFVFVAIGVADVAAFTATALLIAWRNDCCSGVRACRDFPDLTP